MAFKFTPLAIPDVILIEPKAFEDERGLFMETYKFSEFRAGGIAENFIQDNHSVSKKGVLRGLHYQLNPKAQGKLVRALRGVVLDVAVDIRKNSPWYGKWVAEELSDKNRRMLWIPVGFAHGFLALVDTDLIYKTTEEYSPELDRGIIWNDPAIGIDWPVKNPELSRKDSLLPSLQEAENNFIYEEVKR
jgi:dTDP-4-dehydrorhamnose 3,5-epimerase